MSKLAVIQRAYRKKPTNGFCPSPEPAWGEVGWAHLECLECLLRFFHVTSKPAFERLPPQSRILRLANLDVVAVDTFLIAKGTKKNSLEKIQELMIEACATHVDDMPYLPAERKDPTHAWIHFTEAAKAAEKTQIQDKVETAPVAIRFDERTGKQLNAQLEFRGPGRIKGEQ